MPHLLSWLLQLDVGGENEDGLGAVNRSCLLYVPFVCAGVLPPARVPAFQEALFGLCLQLLKLVQDDLSHKQAMKSTASSMPVPF
jgi:hypothetical protein